MHALQQIVLHVQACITTNNMDDRGKKYQLWSLCPTCGCLQSETQRRVVLVREAIRTCSLLAADAQSLPASVALHLASAHLSTVK